MRNSFLIEIVCVVTLTLSIALPPASAQSYNSDPASQIGGGNPPLEEQLKLAREKTLTNGLPTPYLFENPFLIVIPVVIASGGISLVVLMKLRKISSQNNSSR
jgi:hypothetical protein